MCFSIEIYPFQVKSNPFRLVSALSYNAPPKEAYMYRSAMDDDDDDEL